MRWPMREALHAYRIHARREALEAYRLACLRCWIVGGKPPKLPRILGEEQQQRQEWRP